MELYIGVDLHPYQQTVCWLDLETGELRTQEFRHRDRERLRAFYRSQPPSVVGIEASGRVSWFVLMLAEFGHVLKVGDAKKIRRRATSRHKNDRLDAELIWTLLSRGEFPEVCQRPAGSTEVLRMLSHRSLLVGVRTRVCNRLQAIARDAGLERGAAQTARFRERLGELALGGAAGFERAALFGMLDELAPRIAAAEAWLSERAADDQQVVLLRTQDGVGLLTALAFRHYVGEVSRFDRMRQVTAFLGLDPVDDSSADRRRCGSISKEGSPLVRHLVGQAAHLAARRDERLGRFYRQLRKRRPVAVAKTAAARKLAVKLAIMLRDGITAAVFDERGR